jgi:hypothetical protein
MMRVKDFYRSLVDLNFPAFVDASVALGIISTNGKYMKELYDCFLIQCRPWVKRAVFNFSDEWLSESTAVKIEWLMDWKLPTELIWFVRIAFGLNRMFTRMNASGLFCEAMLNYL